MPEVLNKEFHWFSIFKLETVPRSEVKGEYQGSLVYNFTFVNFLGLKFLYGLVLMPGIKI